ncbi:MAG: [citrate (pro-3S)-lyase] ligase [Muribaculaceae bacterium]|nr:[citrate (pro-3S)-lyase] ligase [Muribaculaceae bacterium]
MYSEYEIRSIPLSLKPVRLKVERFLADSGLRLDDVDYYAVVSRIDSEDILAGGGLKRDLIKCLAVSEELRGTGMMQRLISHLISEAHAQGHDCIKVFTKPENRDIFESLGFSTLATAPKAIFMENGLRGLDAYCSYLKGLAAKHKGQNGVIVMNANPFTIGHKALVEWAAAQVDTLFVIAVKENLSLFTSDERLEMIERGCEHLSNVVVCHGSDYAISAGTFPTYFLKKLNDATDTHITLDLDLFARHIAPALKATIRFVGSEPNDVVTARYVELMQELLPQHNIDVRVMPRIKHGDTTVSATIVRKHIGENHLQPAAELVPSTSVPELLGHLASNALQLELDTTPKPGLVDKQDNGAHSDMDYSTMKRSIDALIPYFDELAKMGNHEELPSADSIKSQGLRGEDLMLNATHGVNTHKGAIFALGLIDTAAAHAMHEHGYITAEWLQNDIIKLAKPLASAEHTHGNDAVNQYHVDGALAIAKDGYKQLFKEWLPFYRSLEGDQWQRHKTLLFIMATLDDTNVIHRVGYERAQKVKAEAKALLDNFSIEKLEEMNHEFISENISPGGAADMLSLTIFVSSLLQDNNVNNYQ